MIAVQLAVSGSDWPGVISGVLLVALGIVAMTRRESAYLERGGTRAGQLLRGGIMCAFGLFLAIGFLAR